MAFKRAQRRNLKARVALIGPPGSGKTASALLIAKGLAPNGRIALIDSERGSASKYADTPLAGQVVDFDVDELSTFSPATYVASIREAEAQGFDVLIIDSLSHAWMGKGGALEMVDAATKRSKSRNSFDSWREVTPQHNALVDAMVGCRCHLIVTMRAKTEYILDEVTRSDGRKVSVPRKVGLAPVQRDGLEYEFDLVGEIDTDHTYSVSKTRCYEFDQAVIDRPGVEVGRRLAVWLNSGAVDASPEPAPASPEPEQSANKAQPKGAAKRDAKGAAPQRLPVDVAWNGPHRGTAIGSLKDADLTAYAAWILPAAAKIDAGAEPERHAYVTSHVEHVRDEFGLRGLAQPDAPEPPATTTTDAAPAEVAS